MPCLGLSGQLRALQQKLKLTQASPEGLETWIAIAFASQEAPELSNPNHGLSERGRLLGAAFGILKLAFIASVVIIFVDAANRSLRLIEQETLDASILYTPVKKIAPMILPTILKDQEEESTTPESP